MFSFNTFDLDAFTTPAASFEDFSIDLDVALDLSTLETLDIESVDLSGLNSGSASASGFGSVSASFFSTASGAGSSSVSVSAFSYVAPDGSSFSSVSGSATGDSFFGTGTATAGGNSDSFVFSSGPFEPVEITAIDLTPFDFGTPDLEPIPFDFALPEPVEIETPDYGFSAFLI